MLKSGYNKNERASNLFITFIFVLFFFQFARNFILEKPINKRLALFQTILILVWYGLSMVI